MSVGIMSHSHHTVMLENSAIWLSLSKFESLISYNSGKSNHKSKSYTSKPLRVGNIETFLGIKEHGL